MRTSDFLKTTEGKHYLLCDGQAVSNEYPELKALMTNTPDLVDKVPQGAKTSTKGVYPVGQNIAAGIPNIKGEIGKNEIYRYNKNAEYYGESPSGATLWTGPFYPIWGTNDCVYELGDNPYTAMVRIGFDASQMSSVYRDDIFTVQPPALAVNYYIKAK